MNSDDRLLRTRVLDWVLKNKADSVVCIDETVERTINKKIGALVVHNGLNIPKENCSHEAKYSTDQEPLRVGFVGNLLLQKGILDLVEAAAVLKKDGISCQFLIYGHATGGKKGAIASILEITGIRQDVRLKVWSMVKFYSLEDCFIFKGFTNNLEAAYGSFDLLCFPSHLDAPGRPVLEAAYFYRPSIVAVKNPTPDTIVNKVTGLTIEPRSLAELVGAIKVFHADRSLLRVMGVEAKKLSNRKYDQRENSQKIFKLYDSLISSEN
ncbi:Alpha-D-kanosaminyltransferase [compost metagenome]